MREPEDPRKRYTVGDLVDALEAFPPDTPVEVRVYVGGMTGVQGQWAVGPLGRPRLMECWTADEKKLVAELAALVPMTPEEEAKRRAVGGWSADGSTPLPAVPPSRGGHGEGERP
jgi:hypothetical protein